MEHYQFLISALVLGFFSAPHCVGMCGGIAGALAVASPADASQVARWYPLLLQNLGRLTSYTLLGLVAGVVGSSLRELAPVLTLLFRVVAGLLMVAMGLYVAGWWSGLRVIENAGFRVWQPLLRGSLLQLSSARGYASGVLWGFLPCGLVYTMLATAMATGTALDGALTMTAFGVGTLPTLLAAGMIARELTSLREMWQVRAVMGTAIILFGMWTALSVIWMSARMAHSA